MKIRHCFFSPVSFEVFSSKTAAHCSNYRKPLLTEISFPCIHRGFGSDAARSYSPCSPLKCREISASHHCCWGGGSSPVPTTSSELLTLCGENSPPNNAIIDTDGACSSLFIFSDTCFLGCENQVTVIKVQSLKLPVKQIPWGYA